jgi:hypothetical protein
MSKPQMARLATLTDFIIDEETWGIRYLIIDTGNWWSGKIDFDFTTMDQAH